MSWNSKQPLSSAGSPTDSSSSLSSAIDSLIETVVYGCRFQFQSRHTLFSFHLQSRSCCFSIYASVFPSRHLSRTPVRRLSRFLIEFQQFFFVTVQILIHKHRTHVYVPGGQWRAPVRFPHSKGIPSSSMIQFSVSFTHLERERGMMKNKTGIKCLQFELNLSIECPMFKRCGVSELISKPRVVYVHSPFLVGNVPTFRGVFDTFVT